MLKMHSKMAEKKVREAPSKNRSTSSAPIDMPQFATMNNGELRSRFHKWHYCAREPGDGRRQSAGVATRLPRTVVSPTPVSVGLLLSRLCTCSYLHRAIWSNGYRTHRKS